MIISDLLHNIFKAKALDSLHKNFWPASKSQSKIMNQHSFRQKQKKKLKICADVSKNSNILRDKIFLTIKYNPLPLKWGVIELSSMFGSLETSISNWDIFWQDFGQNCIKNTNVNKKYAD